MTLLERLGKKENKNNGKIFAGRTDKIIEQGYQDLKIAVHRRIVDEMTSEQRDSLKERITAVRKWKR